jgi:peptidyl-prolyl cis-trans isomerase C
MMHATSIAAVRLAGLLLLALTTAAPTAAADAGDDPVVARVNGTPIRASAVNTQLNQIIPRLSFHQRVDEARLRELRREAMQAAIDQELKYQDARRRGLAVSRGEINSALEEAIARYPSEAAFRQRLEDSGFTLRDVRRELRRQEMIRQVEEEVADRDRPLTEAQLKRYYREHRAELVTPQRADLRHIQIKMPPLGRTEARWQAAEAELEAARSRIAAGTPFEVVAQELAEAVDVDPAGSLRKVHEGSLGPELDALVWALSEGELAGPVRTFKGVSLVRVERFYPSQAMAFEEIAPSLRGVLQERASEERLAAWLERLRREAQIVILAPELRPQESGSD